MKAKESWVVRTAVGILLTLPALELRAEGLFEGLLDQVDLSVGGFVRQESAFSTAGDDNPNNQGGNNFQNRSVARQTYLPPALLPVINTGILTQLLPAVQLGTWGSVPLPYADTVKRSDYVPSTSNSFNYVVLRAETEFSLKFGEHFDLIGRVRGLYQPRGVYDEFDAASLSGLQGGISGGDPRLYQGKPNYFDYIVEGGGKANPLEWTGSEYQVYLPALVLDYHQGGLNVRLGNQQIAWGQSIFLRVFDTPNGIDLRRHSILDRGLEEFSDKRVPMLSLRVGYQVTDDILFDGYVGKFQPSVFGNPNTSYNVIPAQFTVHDLYEQGGYDHKFSGGIRFKGDYGDWGWQAAYVNRYNPDGVFRWTESGVNKPLQGGIGSLAWLVNTAYNLKLPASSPLCAVYNPALCRLYADIGEALSHSPFEASPGGVYTADEWFDYAASVRLHGVTGLNAAVNDFPASQDVYATPVETFDQAAAELNTFFFGAGGSLRGHIAREYFREDVFMLGASYVTESDNDFLNELIFNLEGQYIPNRTFTDISLGANFHRADEYTISLVADKWHRFFNEFPGTYIVFELLTKNRSDLVGRLLDGYGGSETQVATGKKGNANYLVFGFLQPWPNKLYELELATLYDPAGGILVQPGLRWHPGRGITIEGYYNHINGDLYGAPNDNLISTLNFAEEFTLRMTYQF